MMQVFFYVFLLRGIVVMENFLLELFRKHAPYMPDSYHQECLNIALDIIRIRAIKKKSAV